MVCDVNIENESIVVVLIVQVIVYLDLLDPIKGIGSGSDYS